MIYESYIPYTYVFINKMHESGARGSLVVKALSYEPEGRGVETR
jgi:hypothetical protein